MATAKVCGALGALLILVFVYREGGTNPAIFMAGIMLLLLAFGVAAHNKDLG
jgi:hypothetical protein